MKVAILAGGMGTRLAEETALRPKPMVEIGGRPILWHIMRHYCHFGFNEFVIGLGYRGDCIKRFMAECHLLDGDLSIDLNNGRVVRHGEPRQAWSVDLVETGLGTATGGRIRRLAPWLGEGTFMLTWGDGVGDIDLYELLRFHRAHGRLATVTAVHPVARFGQLELDGPQVMRFREKPEGGEGWISGAFFVLEPQVLDLIAGDDIQWEREPLERLARDGQLMAFRHTGFWHCMDTMRDRAVLEGLWQSGKAPWKLWR